MDCTGALRGTRPNASNAPQNFAHGIDDAVIHNDLAHAVLGCMKTSMNKIDAREILG
ncbi:hypothetical protein [Candidatus Binatus sp.]|uniref:hypothetical protein n=1 Tax=Candidatus Binatus sp. TaxID=2811406 RepID=UPI003CC55C05